MKLNLLLLISIILCSCSVKNNITGKYISKKNPNYLQLKNDSTFIYEYRFLHLYQHSVGKWEKNGKNLIVLNSEIKDTSIPLFVNSLKKVDEGNNISIQLTINDGDSLANYLCIIYVNEAMYSIKRCDSLTNLSINSPINSLYFMFGQKPLIPTSTYISLPLTSNKFIPEIQSKNNLEIKITFSDKYFFYKPFNNETLKIKTDEVKMFNSYRKKWEKLSKVSDSLRIFSRYDN